MKGGLYPILRTFFVLTLAACSSPPPPHEVRKDPFCNVAGLPKCPAASPALDAHDAERWGPEMNGKRIAVRGSLWLKELTCKIPAASDPVAACQELRRSHLAAIYIGNVAVRLSAPCKCDVKGGRFCPVSDPGQRAVVTGAYRYDAEPREEGAQEDAAPRHLLHDAKICVD